MTDRAKAELKSKDQPRLRSMVSECLRMRWKAWRNTKNEDDATLLRETVDQILEQIRDFETRNELRIGFSSIYAAKAWKKLQKLACDIDAALRSAEDAAQPEPRQSVSKTGSHYKTVCIEALKNLPNRQGTAAQIRSWVEANRDGNVVRNTGVTLNMAMSTSKNTPNRRAWEQTISSCLSHHKKAFKGEKRTGVWKLRPGALTAGKTMTRMIQARKEAAKRKAEANQGEQRPVGRQAKGQATKRDLQPRQATARSVKRAAQCETNPQKPARRLTRKTSCAGMGSPAKRRRASMC